MTTNPTTHPASPAEPTHGCVRCGRPISVDIALCEDCNPLELAQPSASQAHGTVVVGILVAVFGLFLVARLAVAGVGPFTAEVAGVQPAANGISITVTVTNDGSSTGGTTCRVHRVADRGVGANAFLQSPQIAGGATISFSLVVTEFGATPIPPEALAVECSKP